MSRMRDPAILVERAQSGDRAALARLLSLVEEGGDAAREVGRRVHPLGGHAYTVGITGAPGAGKSTLTDRLIAQVRTGGDEVAVLAIDPSSPFTGGAILGDRVRMQDHATDTGVFIRSMATRGHLGGLSLATPEAIRVLDAMGRPWILVETVGVGQVEVAIAGEADTTIVVVNPGWGDAVQANKAGLMEVADLFVINKADRAGTAETRRDLEQMLDLTDTGEWRPPILEAVAVRDEGIAELWQAIVEHRAHLAAGDELERRRRARLVREVREILARRIEQRASGLLSGAEFDDRLRAIEGREVDPWTAADEMLAAAGIA